MIIVSESDWDWESDEPDCEGGDPVDVLIGAEASAVPVGS